MSGPSTKMYIIKTDIKVYMYTQVKVLQCKGKYYVGIDKKSILGGDVYGFLGEAPNSTRCIKFVSKIKHFFSCKIKISLQFLTHTF